jgi:hypothetical protein
MTTIGAKLSYLANLLARASCGAALVLIVTMAVGGPSANAVNLFDDVCRQGGGSSTACNTSGQNELVGSNGVLKRVTDIVAMFAGVAAVIMIIWAGSVYVTSNGDSAKITSAKNTIIYAAVGLVVIALGRTIIYFIVNKL